MGVATCTTVILLASLDLDLQLYRLLRILEVATMERAPKRARVTEENYDKMKMGELRAALSERGLSPFGSKPELITRLKGNNHEAEVPSAAPKAGPPAVLMMGTGEYTTGFAGDGAAKSDKPTGVVGLVCLDLRAQGRVGRIGMCGTNGKKLPQIRKHLQAVLGDVYDGIDPSVIETFPKDTVVDRKAFKAAARSFEPGDVAIVFTPDDTHFEIAMECIKRGMHVMVTKPAVKTLKEHRDLAQAAKEAGGHNSSQHFSLFQDGLCAHPCCWCSVVLHRVPQAL